MQDKVEQIAQHLTEDIRGGHFAPGSWLKQIDLQERYQESRGTIRKVLELLAGRRLIRHERNRGYSVYPPDDAETEKALAVRTVLETGFAEAIVSHASEDDIKDLYALARLFAEQLEAGVFHQLYETNLRFHHRLLKCTGNELLVSIVDDLRLRTAPAPVSQWLNRKAIERSSQEHLKIAEAVEARQETVLRDLLRAHINSI